MIEHKTHGHFVHQLFGSTKIKFNKLAINEKTKLNAKSFSKVLNQNY